MTIPNLNTKNFNILHKKVNTYDKTVILAAELAKNS